MANTSGAIYKGLAEEELLKRVMQNLLKNCLQYSVGEVVVSITKDTDMPVDIFYPYHQSHSAPIAADILSGRSEESEDRGKYW